MLPMASGFRQARSARQPTLPGAPPSDDPRQRGTRPSRNNRSARAVKVTGVVPPWYARIIDASTLPSQSRNDLFRSSAVSEVASGSADGGWRMADGGSRIATRTPFPRASHLSRFTRRRASRINRFATGPAADGTHRQCPYRPGAGSQETACGSFHFAPRWNRLPRPVPMLPSPVRTTTP